ncbi:MAG: GNAT family N-acetyltransferase [Bianqueaceae bacterium]
MCLARLTSLMIFRRSYLKFTGREPAGPVPYLAKDNGKIKAMVCVLPTEFKSGTQVLKAGLLGTVSVHPYARKRGYMKKLMEMAVADMRAE